MQATVECGSRYRLPFTTAAVRQQRQLNQRPLTQFRNLVEYQAVAVAVVVVIAKKGGRHPKRRNAQVATSATPTPPPLPAPVIAVHSGQRPPCRGRKAWQRLGWLHF